MMAWPCWLIRRVFPVAGVPLRARHCSSAPMGHASPAGDGGVARALPGLRCQPGSSPDAAGVLCRGLGEGRGSEQRGSARCPWAPGLLAPQEPPPARWAGNRGGGGYGTAGSCSTGCQQRRASGQRAVHWRAAGSCAMSALTRDSQGGGAAGDPPGTAPPRWWHQPLGPRRQPSATPGLPVIPCFSNETKGGLGFFFFSSSSRIAHGSQI